MLKVGDWLRDLGLQEYQSTFAANGIDGDLLPELKPDDLDRLGVTRVGHRRRMLKAIATMRDAAAQQTEEKRSETVTQRQFASLEAECKLEAQSCTDVAKALQRWHKRLSCERAIVLAATVLVGGLAVAEVVIRYGGVWADYAGGGLLLATAGLIALYAAIARRPDLADLERCAGQFLDLGDRFRQAAATQALGSPKDFATELSALMDKKEEVRRDTPGVPERYLKKVRPASA